MLGLVLGLIAACAPVRQTAGPFAAGSRPPAGFHHDWMVSFDGAPLGLRTSTPALPKREIRDVIIAVHGMNVDGSAFDDAGKWWAEQGAMVYAYDQRGFGRSPGWMIWPDPELMREDLRTAVRLARLEHPGARIAVAAESMGAAMAVTAFASDRPPAADALVLIGPGFRGWGALPLSYRLSLWATARLNPGWIVRPPRFVTITPTDNRDKLIENGRNPRIQKSNRIDSVLGVVSLMEAANDLAPGLADAPPILLLYGARDEVIPESGVRRATRRLPEQVRTAYYADGYHMLVNDLQAEAVWRDILSFLRDPRASPPSGAPPLPWLTANAATPQNQQSCGRLHPAC